MKYDKMADAIQEDVTQYILSNHYSLVELMYTNIIEEYIQNKVGTLNEKTHKQLVKQLVKYYIS